MPTLSGQYQLGFGGPMARRPAFEPKAVTVDLDPIPPRAGGSGVLSRPLASALVSRPGGSARVSRPTAPVEVY